MSEEIIIADLLLGVDVEQPADALIDRTVQNFQNALRGRKIELPVTIADPQQVPTLRAMREQAVAATQAEARADRESLAERRRARNEYANWWKAQLREQEQAERRAAQEGARAAREQAAAERAARQEQAQRLREHRATVALNARLSAQAEREAAQVVRASLQAQQEQVEGVRLAYARIRAEYDRQSGVGADMQQKARAAAEYRRAVQELQEGITALGRSGEMTTRQLTALENLQGRIARERQTLAGGVNNLGLSGNVNNALQANLPRLMIGLQNSATAMSPSLGAAAAQITGMTTAMNGAAAASGFLGAATAGAAIGVGVLATATVNAGQKAMEFEALMDAAKVSVGANAEEFKRLEDAALNMGKGLGFGATQAAAGIEELGSSGVSAAQVLDGALIASMTLARATTGDLAQAAKISAGAMNAFKLEAKDLPSVADTISAAVNNTTISMDNLKDGIAAGGAMAKSFGVDFREYLAMLSIGTDAMLSASDAGTSLKTMFMALTPNSEQAAKVMDKLGFSAFDANGKFIGMEAVIGKLAEATRGMSDEQRAMTLETVFGADAVRMIGLLIDKGADGLRERTKLLDQTGEATRSAAEKMDNAKGATLEWQRATEKLQIAWASGILPTFTKFLNEVATPLVDKVGDLIDKLNKVKSPGELKATLKITAEDDMTTATLKFLSGGVVQLTSGPKDFISQLSVSQLQQQLIDAKLIERKSYAFGGAQQARDIAANRDYWEGQLRQYKQQMQQAGEAVATFGGKVTAATGKIQPLVGQGPLLPGQQRNTDLGTGLGSADTVARLRPEFQKALMQVVSQYALGNNNGLVPYIHEGYRSTERQNQLYAQGRTAPGSIVTNAKGGQSLHNYGVAADIYWRDPKTGKVVSFNDPRAIEAAKALGQLATKQGLLWGGSPGFGIVDMPHIQEDISWQTAGKKYGSAAPAPTTTNPTGTAPQKAFDAYIAEARRILGQVQKYSTDGAAPNPEKWRQASAALERFTKDNNLAAQAVQWVQSETKRGGQEASKYGQVFDQLSRRLTIAENADKLGTNVIPQLKAIRSEAEKAAAAELKRNGQSERYVKLQGLAADAAQRLSTIQNRGTRSTDRSPAEQQAQARAEAKMVSDLRKASSERLSEIVASTVGPGLSLEKWKAAQGEIERRQKLSEQRNQEATRRAAQLAKDRASLEAQLNKDLADGDMKRAQATVGKLQQNLDTQLSLYRDNAAKRLEVEQQLGPQLLAAQKRVLEAERDAAVQAARDKANTQRAAQAKLYGGKDKVPQTILDQIAKVEQDGVNTAETTFSTKLSSLYSAQQERINRATAAVQAKSRQAAEQRVQVEQQVTQQLAQQSAAQRQASIQAERDRLAGLEQQQRERVAAARGNAAQLLQIEKDLGGKIREQQQRVALAMLADAKRSAEEAHARAIASIPKGATAAEVKRLTAAADTTLRESISSAYRTYSLSVSKAATEQTVDLANAQGVLSDKVRTLRDEYAQLADGMRQKIATGKVEDADLAQYLGRLDDLSDKAQKAGLSSNKFIQGAQQSAAALYQAGIDAQIAAGAYDGLSDSHDRASTSQQRQVVTMQDLISALPQSAEQVDGFKAALQDMAQKGLITNEMMERALVLIPDFSSTVGQLGEAYREVEERLESQGKRLDGLNEQYEQGLITTEDYGQQLEALADSYVMQAQAAERLGKTDVAAFFRGAAQAALDLAAGVGHVSASVRELQDILDQLENQRLLAEGIAGMFQGGAGDVAGRVVETFQSGAFGELDEASRQDFLERLSEWLPGNDLRTLGREKLGELLAGLSGVDGVEASNLREAIQGALGGLNTDAIGRDLGSIIERAGALKDSLDGVTDPVKLAQGRKEWEALLAEVQRLQGVAEGTDLADWAANAAQAIQGEFEGLGTRLDSAVGDRATQGLYVDLGNIIERAQALKDELGTSTDPVQLSVYHDAMRQLADDAEALAQRGDGDFASTASTVVSALRDEVTATGTLLEQVMEGLSADPDRGSAALEEMLTGITQELEKARVGLENGTLSLTDYNETVSTQREALDRLYERLTALGPAYAEAARSVDLLRQSTSGMTVDADKLADALRAAELASIRKGADTRQLQYQTGTLSASDLGSQTGQDINRLTLMAANLERMGKAGAAAEVRELIGKLREGLPTLGQAALKLTEAADAQGRMNNARTGIASLVGQSPAEFDVGWQQQVAAMNEAKDIYPQLTGQFDKLINRAKVFKGLNMANHYLGIAQSVGQAAQTIAGAFGQDEIAQGIGKIADGLGQAGQATMDWAKVASGDLTALPAAIMNTVGALDSFLQGIQDLDPAYQKWKKNQLEIASLQRDAMGQKKYNNWLVNPYYDALKQDSANREKLANAKPLQRFAWWLFGNAPQVLDDEAAKAQAKAASIFNDFASDMAGTFEQEMLSAWEEGDFSNVADKMGKQLDRFVARLAIQTVMAKSNLSKLVQNLAEEVARKGDTSDEIAAIRSEYNNIIGTSQAVLSALPGYGSGAEGGTGQGGNLFGNAPTAQLGIPRIEVSLPEPALQALTDLSATAGRIEALLDKGLTLNGASLQVSMPDSFLQGSALWASTMPMFATAVPVFAKGSADLAGIPAEFRAVLAEWRASMRSSGAGGPPPHSGNGGLA
ncbi:phage tail tape measure protein [Deinococcus sp. VB343]|uniref:phage tail tape measure protein n=1 Tax=Deinococcus sp. VB343 TaxID=3385567 RepID=UPI0039C8FB62